MVRVLSTIILTIVFIQAIWAQRAITVNTIDTLLYLDIPERPENAISGSAFVAQVTGKSIEDRECAVIREILSGNVPSFSRTLTPLKICRSFADQLYELICYVTCDYLAIGSDQDYLYIPLTAYTAQYLADQLNCILPTGRIVDHIYKNSDLTLSPQPIPPSDTMTSIQVFAQHQDSIEQQISGLGLNRSAFGIVAGHKKDIIISNKIYSPDRSSEKVVIYGWHLSENNPIQPVYNGHMARYTDYSHGVRLISRLAYLNDKPIQLNDILRDPDRSSLISNEGIIFKPFYPESKY